MTEESNKQLARRFVEEVWNGKDLDLIDELYHPDYTGHWFQVDGTDATRDDLKEFVAGIHEGFPDYEMDVEFILAEDDLVSLGFTGMGTHENEWMGIPPSGETEAPERPTPGHMSFRVEDDQIVEGWATWDALGLMQALGVLPENLSAMAPTADD
jgi:predicted ester cyclase